MKANTSPASGKLRLERWTEQGLASPSTNVQLWTDGSCVSNPGPGGYAALLIDGNACREITGFEPASTNNRLELTAVIRGLAEVDPVRSVTVFTDSTYVLQAEAITANGRPSKVNSDLWAELLAVVAKRSAPITWAHVRAHSGIASNERADHLAKQAAGVI